MKFGRLLAAGKSLVSGNVAGRYRMRDNMRLPQFISPKNPFAAEATVEESTAPTVAAEERGTIASVVTPAKRVAAVVGWTGGAAKSAALWCLDHNPFSAIGRPRLPTMPRFGKPPVQGELSLDKVKVVRGDLAHADLEVVRAGGDADAPWRNLTTRVFGGEAR